MAVTHFEIKKLPNPDTVTSKVGIVSLQENTLYPISDQANLSFERTAELQNLFLEESGTIVLHDDVNSLASSETPFFLKWKTNDGALVPAAIDLTETLAKNITVNLLSKLSLNKAVEFIEIESISGVYNLKFNDVAVLPGQRFLTKELITTTYQTNAQGGGSPYFVLQYKVGKNNVLENTVFTYTIDVVSLAEVSDPLFESVANFSEEFDVGGTPTTYNTKVQSYPVDFIEGYQNATAQITITINSPYLSLNTWNKVIIQYGSEEIEKFANESFTIEINLDSYGKGGVLFQNYIVEDTADPKTGQINVVLDSINSNPALVSATDTLIINTNY